MRSGGGISNAPSSAASREPISLRPPGIQALASLETITSRPPGIDHAHPGSYRDTMQRTHAALARLEHAERLTSSDGEVANAARVQRNALGARVEQSSSASFRRLKISLLIFDENFMFAMC